MLIILNQNHSYNFALWLTKIQQKELLLIGFQEIEKLIKSKSSIAGECLENLKEISLSAKVVVLRIITHKN